MFNSYEEFQREYTAIYKSLLKIVKDSGASESYYEQRYKNLFRNQVNGYVNYVNLKLISQFLSSLSIKSPTLLDLGCGIGDKGIVLKKSNPNFYIFGLETTVHDDPDHQEGRPHEFYEKVYPRITSKHNVVLRLYDGYNVNVMNESLDVILLYAVIEHIAPTNRDRFLRTIEGKLKKDGHFIITRCPRYYGFIELVSRKLRLGAHEWVLKKDDLLTLFPKNAYSIEEFRTLNNVPNNYNLTSKAPKLFIYIDKVLQTLKWPFATDYFLIVRKL